MSKLEEYMDKMLELLMAQKFGKDEDQDPILDEMDAIWYEMTSEECKSVEDELEKMRSSDNIRDVDVVKYPGSPVYVKVRDLF